MSSSTSFFAHPHAIVESTDVGAGTRVWAFAHVMQGARIGAGCNIGEHCFVEGGAAIGDNVTLKNGVQVWDGVTLEDDVFVGPQAVFTNDLYPRSPRSDAAGSRYDDKRTWLVPTLVRSGASLGAGAVLVAGRTVGRCAMVAAGAVVTRDVPDFALVRGNPGVVVGWVCRCGTPLELTPLAARCRTCELEYELKDGVLAPAATDVLEIRT